MNKIFLKKWPEFDGNWVVAKTIHFALSFFSVCFKSPCEKMDDPHFFGWGSEQEADRCYHDNTKSQQRWGIREQKEKNPTEYYNNGISYSISQKEFHQMKFSFKNKKTGLEELLAFRHGTCPSSSTVSRGTKLIANTQPDL